MHSAVLKGRSLQGQYVHEAKIVLYRISTGSSSLKFNASECLSSGLQAEIEVLVPPCLMSARSAEQRICLYREHSGMHNSVGECAHGLRHISPKIALGIFSRCPFSFGTGACGLSRRGIAQFIGRGPRRIIPRATAKVCFSGSSPPSRSGEACENEFSYE